MELAICRNRKSLSKRESVESFSPFRPFPRTRKSLSTAGLRPQNGIDSLLNMEEELSPWESWAGNILCRWYVFFPLTLSLSLVLYGITLDDFPIPETFAHMLPFSLAALIDQVWNGLWNFCRPTAMVIFRIGYALFGANYVGYRVMLLLIHLLNVLLVCAFAKVLFKNRMAALVTGLIFATHPIHSECISLVVSLFDVSCMTFFLASLLAFEKYLRAQEAQLKARARIWLLATCLLEILCFGSKEVGVMLPLVMIAYDAFTRVRKERLVATALDVVKRSIPFLLILAAYLIFRIARYEQNVSYVRLFVDDPRGVLANLMAYFRLTLFPNQMWILLLAALPFARKQYIFTLVFLLLPLLPPLQIEPQERFVYIASGGYSLALAWCAVIGWRRIGGVFRQFTANSNAASIGSAAALLLAIAQIPFAVMNTHTWSESIPIRKALSSIWKAVGRPEQGNVLYFANLPPQFNLAGLSEYDYTSVGRFRCEKLINYVFEDHSTPEFVFEMVGNDARLDESLAQRCRQLEAQVGRMSYGQPDTTWGRDGLPLSEWSVERRTHPQTSAPGENDRLTRKEIEIGLVDGGPVILHSPALDMSTLSVSAVVIEFSRITEAIDCKLQWTLQTGSEVRSSPISTIHPPAGREGQAIPLTSSRWQEPPGQHAIKSSKLVSIDLGSRPEWVFEEERVGRVSLWLRGAGRPIISMIKLESPSRTKVLGLKPMVQFHE